MKQDENAHNEGSELVHLLRSEIDLQDVHRYVHVDPRFFLRLNATTAVERGGCR